MLRQQVVYGPALAALGDLTNGPGAAQPARDGTITEPLDNPKDCEAVLQEIGWFHVIDLLLRIVDGDRPRRAIDKSTALEA